MIVFNSAGQVGIATTTPKAALSIGDGNILAEGAYSGTLSAPVTGAGTRFMWLPSVAAIRAGNVDGTQWDTVGNYSAAFGHNTQAAGDYSIAAGHNNSASGPYSMAVGGGSNEAWGSRSAVAGGDMNKVYGDSSFISGGSDNIVHSTFSWAGGYNNYLDILSSGTFVWGYDDNLAHGTGINNSFRITEDYVFLIDPSDTKGYKVGVGTPSPQARLDVKGSAQFGVGTTTSAVTADGFWVPRSMTSAELQAAGGTPPVVGAVVFNSIIQNLCVSTGTAVGQWAIVGTKGNCI
jgi:hypothetical protein